MKADALSRLGRGWGRAGQVSQRPRKNGCSNGTVLVSALPWKFPDFQNWKKLLKRFTQVGVKLGKIGVWSRYFQTPGFIQNVQFMSCLGLGPQKMRTFIFHIFLRSIKKKNWQNYKNYKNYKFFCSRHTKNPFWSYAKDL